MAKYKKTEIPQFQDLHRGTSVTIPVLINRKGGHDFDLTGYKAIFTLKAEQFDHDYDDERALISREFELDGEDAKKGKFHIRLSSKDTWLHPGMYWFDIMLVKGHGVARIALYKVEILGGPSNMMVDHEVGDDMWMTDAIEHTPGERESVTITTALVSDPPENLIETIVGSPSYIVRKFDDPVRNVQVQSYAPRLSLMVPMRVRMDSTWYRESLEKHFGNFKIDKACPLAGAVIEVKDSTFKITGCELENAFFTFMGMKKVPDPSVVMKPSVENSAVAEPVYPPNEGEQVNVKYVDEPYSKCQNWTVNDGVTLPSGTMGRIHIQMWGGNDYINIEGTCIYPTYTPAIEAQTDEVKFATFMLRFDWFNWVDPEVWPEPDKTPETEEDTTVNGKTYAPGPDSVWPPELFYGTE